MTTTPVPSGAGSDTRSDALSDRVVTPVAELFKLLGDPTRMRILLVLDAHDEQCVHEIAALVGTNETKVSQALRLLRTAGIVRNRRDGRHVHYRLDDDHVRTLLRVAVEHLEHTGLPRRGQP